MQFLICFSFNYNIQNSKTYISTLGVNNISSFKTSYDIEKTNFIDCLALSKDYSLHHKQKIVLYLFLLENFVKGSIGMSLI